MRSFIAFDFDEQIKIDMHKHIEHWRKMASGVKWVGMHGMHLTLKFLGNIDPEKLPLLRETIEKAASHHSPFPIKLKGTGSFPPRSRNPRVLWIGIEADPALSSLHAEIETQLAQQGFPRETHAFHPHLTLGRVKKSPLPAIMTEDFRQYHETVFGEMLFRKITLFQSRLSSSGAQYSTLAEAYLT